MKRVMRTSMGPHVRRMCRREKHIACYKHRVVAPVVSSLLFTHNPPSVSESITGLYRGQWCDVVVDSALLMQGPRLKLQQGYLGACATAHICLARHPRIIEGRGMHKQWLYNGMWVISLQHIPMYRRIH